MQSLSQQLPPLDSLVAFEAAARHSSFTLAAAELNLTQSAVSQRIRGLEDVLGVQLFTRRHRAVSLTEAGRAYRQSVAMALSHVAGATARLNPAVGTAHLTVAADQAVAAHWLMPRLDAFMQAHPGISVRFIVSDVMADCLAEQVDAAIVYGGYDAAAFHCAPLIAEEIFPVCSPGYLAAHPEIATIAGLAAGSLIDYDGSHLEWVNWRIWLTEVGNIAAANPRHIEITSYPLVIAAAKAGMGVALGWRYLDDKAISQGELVRPLKASLTTRHGYNLLTRSGARSRHEIEVFAAWLNETRLEMF